MFTTILVLSQVAIWTIFGGILYESYTKEWKAASLFVGNVDSLLTQDIARTIDLFDLSLKAAASGVADPQIMQLPPALRQRVLFGTVPAASGLGAILIFDTEGNPTEDSYAEIPRHLDATTQDFFKIHVDGKYERELFVSHPFKSFRQDGMWMVGLSRRLNNPDGSFAGVVLGSMKLGYFSHLFGAVDLPAGSTITIVLDDGTILMRSPFRDIGRNMSGSNVFQQVLAEQSGSFARESTIDRTERLFAFKRIGRLPAVLIVGIPTARFLDPLRWRMAFVALGFFILSGLILILAVTLGRELHRRTMAERSLSELAATDGLTTLANRRHFDEILDHEWSRAVRDGSSIALLMVDGDFFKAYNDTYGHLQGDQVLRQLAEALRDCVQRPADLVARFGGEEFAVLLPGIDLDGALLVGETIRAAVARLDCPHTGSPLGRLTVSIGVAACLPKEAGLALGLVQAADFALYEAKENGRDRAATGERLDLTRFGWRAPPMKRAS